MKNKGITLIALVITIIVLLILAGVSIVTLTGDNGILTKTQTAKTETDKASYEEQRQLAQLNAIMHTEKYDYETEDKGEDGKSITVPIPAGFAPTEIEGENTVENGFVITDSKGNEFVWIPCKYSNDVDGNEVVYNQDDENGDNRDNDWKEKQFVYKSRYNGGTWYDVQPHNEGMKSVQKYGGFYIARYEAGIPSDAPFYANKEGDTYHTDTEKNTSNYIPVSKKGQPVWNFISQTNAQLVAEKMIDNQNVKSYLIDSHAWNTVCRIIKQKGKLSEDKLENSTEWGNYYDNKTTKYENIKGLWALHMSNSSYTWAKYASSYNYGVISSSVPPRNKGNNRLELATGLSDDFKVYNIYDMAGNVWEWTTEVGIAR